MVKRLTFLICFFSLFSQAFSQPQDSSFTAETNSSDSLTNKSISDTLPVVPSRTFIQSNQFREEVFRSFSLADVIASEDIDHSIAESIGDLLQLRSLVDVVKIGPWGEPEHAYLTGNGRGINIFIDGNLFQQQDLYFPEKGNFDLNSILLSNISRVEFMPPGLANLWGNGSGVMGVNIITKDFDGGQPYSKVMADRGPYGFHKTQVELGRRFTSRGKFYLTGEFKKSDGYVLNSDYDGLSLSGKTTFNLTRNMDLRFSAYQYQTKMGSLLFPNVSFQDVRNRVNNWGAITSLLVQEKDSSILNLNLRYDRQHQEVKSRSYNFEEKKIEEMFAVTATQIFRFKDRHQLKIESYGERKSLESLKMKRAIQGGYLSLADAIKMNPKLRFLLFSKIEKEEELDIGLSASEGVSYQISRDVNLFSTCGRFVGYPTLTDRFWLPFSLSLKDTIADYMEGGNNKLRSQKSFVVDLGTSIQKESYQLSVYIFHSRIDDFIFWSNADTSVYYGRFQPVNSKAKMWGANIDWSFLFLNHVRTYVSYSFKQGKDLNRKTRLAYLPEHSLFSYIELDHEFLKREIGLILRLETDGLSDRFMDEYEKDNEPKVAVVNGKITIRFLDFHFYYVVRNLTDRVYRLSNDYSMPGRTFWWGFYWEFFD